MGSSPGKQKPKRGGVKLQEQKLRVEWREFDIELEEDVSSLFTCKTMVK